MFISQVVYWCIIKEQIRIVVNIYYKVKIGFICQFLNRGWLYDSITRNQDSGSVSYRWTHGENDVYMGGYHVFSIPYF